MKRSLAAFALVAGLAGASVAFAAAPTTTIKVSLEGEGGSAMKIALDKATAPAGEVLFNVANAAAVETHEMVLIKLKHANDKLPLIAGKHRIDEAKLKSMGEVAELEAGKSGELKVKLAAGDYMLICNIKGHYEAGMATPFTVTK